MGQGTRKRPKRLAAKLSEIRRKLGLTQEEMIRRLGLTKELTQNRISAYELGEREPQLHVLLAYARAIGSGAYLEHLIDDKLDLPDRLPSIPKSDAVKRKKATKKR